MTFEARSKAVSDFDFTERQARFLVTVMLHGGVCVPRQYARFVGTAYGQNVNAFFDKLVSAGLAVRCGCVHNRARVYHVRHALLYRAIGEPNSRNRKPVPAASVAQRLMVLDAVIAHPQLTWLATVADKVAYFTVASACPTEAFPHSNFGAGATGRVRLFPDALPIGVDAAGHVAFVFVVTSPDTDDLRGFLQRHADLVSRLRGWTIRLVLPPHLSMMKSSLETLVGGELATPLSPMTLAELRWYFDQRRLATPARTRPHDDRFRRAEGAFTAKRFRLLYRRWLTDGEPALDVAVSPAIRDALASGMGQIQCQVLPASYRHLSPLASLVRPRLRGVEEGEQTLARPQPLHVERDDDDPAGCARDWRRLMGAR